MSLTAGVTVLVVLLVRLFLKKLPKKYSYLLWSVVGFRLLCPVSFDSIFSIFNLNIFSRIGFTGRAGAAADAMTDIVTGAAAGAATDMVLDAASGAINNMVTGAASGATTDMVSGAVSGAMTGMVSGGTAGTMTHTVTGDFNILKLAVIVWIVGMAVMLVYGIAAYIMMARKVRNAIWSERNVYHSDRITSPFVFGFVHPRIYMPSFIESGASEYVLLHENYHIQRHDHIVKPLAFVLLCIHWFNPLVWAAFYVMGRDMEMSCDEAVIGKMITEQTRITDGMSECEVVKRYSYALLNCASHGRFNALFQPGFGEASVKGRIKNALKYKKFSRIVTAVMVGVCVIVLAACGTNSKDDSQKVENPMTPEKMMQISETLRFTSGKISDDSEGINGYTGVKVVNDGQGNSTVVWDKDSVRLDENIAPAGIYDYSAEVDIDGDGEPERILKCQYSIDDPNAYRTFILDRQDNGLKCVGLPSRNIVTARAYDNYILEVKVDYEQNIRVYDCSKPGKNKFLKELRESLEGVVWDSDGRVIAADSADGLSKSVAAGFGQELASGFNLRETEAGFTVDSIDYYVNIWLSDENNIKFAASLTYKLNAGEPVFQSGSVLDRTESGGIAGQLDENFEWKEADTAKGIELDMADTHGKWTEQKLEIARSLYKEFTPCAASLDGEWLRALFNEEYDVLITQENTDAYGIYHGGEYISVPVGMAFATENNVTIRLADVNEDGMAELYIHAYLGGCERNQLIGLEPLAPLVDSYSNAGNDLMVRDYVKEYKLTDAWIGEDDKVHVSAEFVMNSGKTYQTECIVEDADRDGLEDFVIEPVFFDTVIAAEYPYEVKQDIRFRVNQGSRARGNGYIFMSIPLQYDKAADHYIEQGDIELYYREMSPANWG